MSEPTYLAPGTVLAQRYEVGREIGRGGYSVVYEARDGSLGATVAIKLLVPPPAGAALARERMRREVQAVRGLAHANIVAVHDFLEDGSWSFVVLEYVPGPDLAVRVAERGPCAPDDAAHVGRDVALALGAAHRQGILHRDVKPQNILLAPDGRARLTDFGAARLAGLATVTQTGGLVGTIAYLAPELLAGGRGDARSDLYSLGLTLYFALSGRLPDRPSPHLPPAARAEGHHPRAVHPDVPEWLDGIVARATRADPADRYHAADELADALEARRGEPGATSVREAALDFCPVCGSPDGAGLTICPDCRGVPAGPADTLIFVAPSPEPAGRPALRARVARLLEHAHAPATDAAHVAGGARALLRVARANAGAVIEQLRMRAVPARAVPAGRAWSAVPVTLYALVVAVALVGLAAGRVALPALLAMTPVIAGLLLVAGHRAVQRPVVTARAQPPRLPSALDRQVSTTLAALPAGPARRLLADLARLAQRAPADDVAALLAAACPAALDLAGLDETLGVLERRREDAGKETERWSGAIAEAERARDRLVQQLLDALAAVQQATLAGGPAASGTALAELTRDLGRQTAFDEAARREVDALLGPETAARPGRG